MAKQSFAQIGNVFNDATTKLVGGVWNTVNSGGNAASIQSDLQSVQSNLQQLIQQNADQFQGATGIHAQEIVNQLNLEIANVQQAAAGTNAFAPKEINDIQRDIMSRSPESLHRFSETRGFAAARCHAPERSGCG